MYFMDVDYLLARIYKYGLFIVSAHVLDQTALTKATELAFRVKLSEEEGTIFQSILN